MLNISVNIAEPMWKTYISEVEEIIEKAACSAFEHGKYFSHLLNDEQNIILSVECTNDNHIQHLNKEYRGKDKPTNVLSFPQLSEDMPQIESIPVILGDVVLSFETMKREAEEQEKTFSFHLSHLVVHGVLHLLGFDHIEDDDAEKMENLEKDVMKKLGYESPYIEDQKE